MHSCQDKAGSRGAGKQGCRGTPWSRQVWEEGPAGGGGLGRLPDWKERGTRRDWGLGVRHPLTTSSWGLGLRLWVTQELILRSTEAPCGGTWGTWPSVSIGDKDVGPQVTLALSVPLSLGRSEEVTSSPRLWAVAEGLGYPPGAMVPRAPGIGVDSPLGVLPALGAGVWVGGTPLLVLSTSRQATGPAKWPQKRPRNPHVCWWGWSLPRSARRPDRGKSETPWTIREIKSKRHFFVSIL